MGWVEKLPSGKYRAVYRDRRGRRHSAGTFTHKRAAENAAAVEEDAARKVGWRDPNAAAITWSEWVEQWWPTRAVEPGTLKVDANRRDARLTPRWGNYELGEITRQDVRSWISELQASNLSPATVQRHVSLLSASLAAAVDAELLRDNPASKMRIVQGERDEMRFLTRPEFAAISAALPTEFDQALAALLVGTGARWGEGIGLQIQRIDLARHQVRIAETWDDRMRRVKPYPKGRSIRTVPLAGWVQAQLEPLIDGRHTGHVFERRGVLVSNHNWRARIWVPALKTAGVGPVRIHDLRHTFASWLIQDGVPLADVGRLMGHISWATTQRYAHLVDDDASAFHRIMVEPRGAAVGQQDDQTGQTGVTAIRPRGPRSKGTPDTHQTAPESARR